MRIKTHTLIVIIKKRFCLFSVVRNFSDINKKGNSIHQFNRDSLVFSFKLELRGFEESNIYQRFISYISSCSEEELVEQILPNSAFYIGVVRSFANREEDFDILALIRKYLIASRTNEIKIDYLGEIANSRNSIDLMSSSRVNDLSDLSSDQSGFYRRGGLEEVIEDEKMGELPVDSCWKLFYENLR